MSEYDQENGQFSIYVDSYKVDGEIWLNIQTIDDKTGEVYEDLNLPLTVFDSIIMQRDSLIRDAVELNKGTPGPQGPTMAG